MDDGHCGPPTDELSSLAQKLLEVSPEVIETAIGLELQDGTVIADNLDDRRCRRQPRARCRRRGSLLLLDS